MYGWIVQRNGKVPAAVNVAVFDVFDASPRSPGDPFAGSNTTWCVMVWKLKVTVVPTATLSDVGLNTMASLALMVLGVVGAGFVLVVDVVPVGELYAPPPLPPPPLHAARPSNAAAIAIRSLTVGLQAEVWGGSYP